MKQLASIAVTGVLGYGLLALVPTAFAQPGAFNPPLLDCGMQGEVEVVCGTRAPEDFEVTPDGRYLLVAKLGEVVDPSLDLYNLASQQFSHLPLSAQKTPGWGQPDCEESIGDQVSAHGLSLSRRSSGEWQLYVVNHNLRESLEMYELLPEGNSWRAVWRGCVLAEEAYNDVSALPDGSFVATRPQSLQQDGQNLFAGEPSGDVAMWTAAQGERVFPGTEIGYPNGVLVSEDGRFAYISGWTTQDFHQYDISAERMVGHVELGFMPDNLSWTPEGNILAAGIKGVQGNCPDTSQDPCLQGVVGVEVEPDTLRTTVLFDNQGRALLNGTSVAIEAAGALYVGSFQGTRMLKIPR